MKADNAVAGGMHPWDASCLHSLSGIGVPRAECSTGCVLFYIFENKVSEMKAEKFIDR